jgi:hypothetical protein
MNLYVRCAIAVLVSFATYLSSSSLSDPQKDAIEFVAQPSAAPTTLVSSDNGHRL